MKINEKCQAGLPGAILDTVSYATTVLNHRREIVYHNRAFSGIFGGASHLGKKIGESVTCRGSLISPEDENENVICANCKLLHAINLTFENKNNQPPDTFLMQLSSGSKEFLKVIGFQTWFLEFEKLPYVLIVFEDSTTLGEKALQHSTPL